MFLLLTTIATAAPILELGGSCPGPIDLWLFDATPETVVYFLSASAEDVVPLGGTPCRGTLLPLGRPTRVVSHTHTDVDGRAHLRPRVHAPDCSPYRSPGSHSGSLS